MPKASEVAAELRKFADNLDRIADTEISKVYATVLNYSAREQFLALATALPRPFTKTYKDDRLTLEYDSPAFWINSQIQRHEVCNLVEPAQPAVYDCEPLLSEEDHAALGVE